MYTKWEITSAVLVIYRLKGYLNVYMRRLRAARKYTLYAPAYIQFKI